MPDPERLGHASMERPARNASPLSQLGRSSTSGLPVVVMMPVADAAGGGGDDDDPAAASGAASPSGSNSPSRSGSPLLRRMHTVTLCTRGRESEVKLLTHPSQALTAEEFVDRGLDQDLVDRGKFKATSYQVEPLWDPATNVTKRCAKPNIFRVSEEEVRASVRMPMCGAGR